MATEYLTDRNNKTIAKSEALLTQLPYYVRQFYDHLKSSKKELTRYAYIQDIKDFLEYLSPTLHEDVKDFSVEILGKLSAPDISAYKNYLLEKPKEHKGKPYAESTVKRKLASLSSFFKYLVNIGFVDKNPADSIEWPKEKARVIIYLDEDQTAKLLRGIYANNKQIYYLHEEQDEKGRTTGELTKAKSTVKGKSAVKGKPKNKYQGYVVEDIDELTRKRREKVRMRNYCIVLLFLKTGIRVSELIAIDLDDIDFRNTIINIIGKRDKARPVGFGEPEIVDALKNYINNERKKLLGNNQDEKALFVSSTGKRISVRNVETMIKEMVQTYLADEEFLKQEDFSPHKLRSTCATRLLKQTGGDIKGVSEFLGHDSIEITARRYAAISQINNAKAMEEKTIL